MRKAPKFVTIVGHVFSSIVKLVAENNMEAGI
jgi:hypothetical protein